MRPDERSEARRLCEAATKGPWSLNTQDDDDAQPLVDSDATGCSVALMERDNGDETMRPNAEFIALARTALPQALDEIDRLEQRLAIIEPVDLANLLDRLRYIAEQRGHFASCTPEHCECGLATTLHDAHAAIVALGGHRETQG